MSQSSRPEDLEELYRALPSVDDALRGVGMAALEARVGRKLLTTFVAQSIAQWRAAIRRGELDAAALAELQRDNALARAVADRIAREEGRGVRRAINATGVVLHTGLGRAPVHPLAAQRMAEVAQAYCVLEVDRYSGERNQRDERLSELLQRLTGAEAAIAVNNNAAAVFLCLQTLAAGREVIVSRGELVEIGGSFRVPDVMARAGVRLMEVGTTNRTRAVDYEQAIGPATGMLMKVHRSNFKMLGFVEELGLAELAELGRKHSLPTCFDLGSGLIERADMSPIDILAEETRVAAAVAGGVDVVTFSGDKLLGGPQAGLLAGKRAAIAALRANPMYRALRLDKVAIAGLEVTLELLLAGRGDELPARALMLKTAQQIQADAQSLAQSLVHFSNLSVQVRAAQSEPGSGSAPGTYLPTYVLCLKHGTRSAQDLAAALRAGEPPVFTRIQDGALVLDPRALLSGDLSELGLALQRVLRQN